MITVKKEITRNNLREICEELCSSASCLFCPCCTEGGCTDFGGDELKFIHNMGYEIASMDDECTDILEWDL